MFKKDKFATAVFLTFSGNCQQALTLYQACFGGSLRFETFGPKIPGYREWPVVSGSLVSERVVIHGSDLVHDEGRKLGNYMAIFLSCKNASERKALVEKLNADQNHLSAALDDDQKLIEIRDAFDVRWVLSL